VLSFRFSSIHVSSIDAIARSLQASTGTADPLAAAISAASSALDHYRQRPNRIGRARMFADKSVGMDDAGMVAVLRMVEGLRHSQRTT